MFDLAIKITLESKTLAAYPPCSLRRFPLVPGIGFGVQLVREFVNLIHKEYLLIINELNVSLLTLPPVFGSCTWISGGT
ncbi:hypothetical protein GQ457_12G013950 [Hibiscus cannabinus]